MNPKVNPFKNLLQVIYDKIKGVEYGEKTVVELDLNNETTMERIRKIVGEIDHRCILNFYDAFYELHPTQKPTTRGDSGAFTEVRKDGNTLKARLGNHGGFKQNGKWLKISEQELIDRIYNSRMFNAGKMWLESRPVRKQWRKIENGKGLYEFHHNISDKKNLC
ncbi:hypothetical protein OZ410_09240 [Robiginitalea sp. M366]|uniref:hypothetical protein n=1 Tax=Robiginitalea aestuariiviva TaxID=3036903 RepID=UPI00240D6E21|nr:hypothetical protein [Robiginitalea aestuariiviva]MDG1572499.1 hypothetical protein [Robiginitalea aestuariiviva]